MSRTMIVAICLFVSLQVFFSGCATKQQKKPDEAAKSGLLINAEEIMQTAQRTLRLDDYREFEKAEFRFLALRFWKTEDVQLAGWLAQLYVAWAEQLKNEVDFMRIRIAAQHSASNDEQIAALLALIDYRLAMLNEVEESARMLCNSLRTYYPTEYISHRVMADYFRIMGDRENMENQLLVLKELNPDSVGLLFTQGAAKMEFEGDSIGAIRLFDKALGRDPLFVKALYFKGLAFDRMGSTVKAAELMKKVLELSPGHPGARAYLEADNYLKLLASEARDRLKFAMSEEVDDPEIPSLLYWVGEWVSGKPKLTYRLAAPRHSDAEVKVIVSLVLDGEQVLASAPREFKLKANSFTSESHFFDLSQVPQGKLDILIKLMEKKGEGYNTLSIRKAQLPEKE